MRHFQRINTITGWLVFVLSASVYIRTVEPTASFWDCSEFIATAFKLQVPHPPGAPLFLLTYRLFSFLSFGDTTQVAFWMNVASAVCSAFTILFLYWSIVLLGRKMLKVPFGSLTPSQAIGLIGAGLIGSLAYTFSDSFWFSAVEAEVYAMSSMLTAVVVWAILRWDILETTTTSGFSSSLRWLILIAYIMGLSIGVHLLNLVTIPALALLIYFKQYTPTFRGALLAFSIGGVAIFVVMLGVRILLPTLAGEVEILAVNGFGLPFGSGIAFFIVLFLGGLVWAIRYSIRRQRVWLNTGLLAFAFVLIGYSSYTVALIRSNYNPPINENQPDDVLSFVYYLNLKQYPTRPLFHGPYFTAPITDVESGAPIYIKGKDRYEIADREQKVTFDPRQMTLLPRIYSRDRNDPAIYRQILGLPEGKKPSFADNLRFMFGHQLGYMYGRYFMWNFAGREGDQEEAGWIPFLATKKNLPQQIAQNKGNNNYYWLPLLLGLAGLIFQYRRNPQGFLFTFLLFFMMGAALMLYLNTPPTEPRARDYIYVGSYYAFAIWIGLGVLALASFFQYLIRNQLVGTSLAAAACLIVPGIMADQGWDDHDRSGRYVAVDTAKNMLNACAPNAILFTNGDNDTFPLWYAQEVEGFRTDVRVVISGYLNFDWYVEQMKRPVYQSAPLPISLDFKNFQTGTNNQLAFVENPAVKEGINLPEYLKLVKEDSPAIKMPLRDGGTITILPSSKLVLPLDKEAIRKQGIVAKRLEGLLTDTMTIPLNKGDLFKDDLVFLDILSTNNWKRPIYFSSVANAAKYNLEEYTQIEGPVCRLLPVKVSGAENGYVNSKVMYRNLMQKSVWKGLNNPAVYHDSDSRERHIFPARLQFYLLAQQLIREGETRKAREVMLRSLAVIPDHTVPYDRADSVLVSPLLAVGEEAAALQIASVMAKRADENLTYYFREGKGDGQAIGTNLAILNDIASALKAAGHSQAGQYEAMLQMQANRWRN